MSRVRSDSIVSGNAAVSGAAVVVGALTAASLNRLTFADAPVEVDSASETLADDIYAALVTLGLLVDVA